MARIADIVARMRRNPIDVRFSDLSKVCLHYFGEARQQSTSHRVYRTPWKRNMALANDRYSYRVTWSEEDQEYVGLCVEFPSASWLAATHEAALKGIRKLVASMVADMKKSGEVIPEPIATRSYSGKFMVRVPPEVHRKLALKAAENGVSLNRLASAKLTE